MLTIGDTSQEMARLDPDTHLMLRVRADEPGAFEELVERYQQRLVTVLEHLVQPSRDGEDLAQEVLFRVYRARKKYRARARFSTWLFTIANNVARTARRTWRRQSKISLDTWDAGASRQRAAEQASTDATVHPAWYLEQEELAAVIQQALGKLNDRQRLALLLNKIQDMPYEEVAQAMGLSTAAIKSLLRRARLNLRQALREHIYFEGQPWPKENDEH